ncbi:hypothetical protein DPMN_188812 [Dreissena polymorpha]|uniref:Uncharacterized protein n=1 Tax=Dreissena polymorpha TaxID=45954 RepID=A0A9D4IAA0_DREPO|nr:hypothetical protein DPMN_188812 [Dreissena polymorpha]
MELLHVIELASILHLKMVDWTVWEQELRVRRESWIRVPKIPEMTEYASLQDTRMDIGRRGTTGVTVLRRMTCSASCDGGRKTRNRACNNPLPSLHDRNCDGPPQDVDVCNSASCTGHDIIVETSNSPPHSTADPH